MFGKTRLGKSNVVKIIAQSLIETTRIDRSVGQLIFDVNGEYANDNPQDDSRSLRSAYEDRCQVYALTQRESTPSRPLKLNFYEQPDSCIEIIRGLLEQAGDNAQYVRSFRNTPLPNINEIKQMPPGGDRNRAVRRVQIYWAILNKAGFPADEPQLRRLGLAGVGQHAPRNFDPHFNRDLIAAVYDNPDDYSVPTTLDELQTHLEAVQRFRIDNRRW